MVTKLQLAYPPVLTELDITIRDIDGLVWRTDTEVYEVWDDLNIALYVVLAVYQEGNMYLVQWPLTMPDSSYMYIVTRRIAAPVPSLTDHFIGGGFVIWSTGALTVTGIISGTGVHNIVHDSTQIINPQG